jgi:hypothetical protein
MPSGGLGTRYAGHLELHSQGSRLATIAVFLANEWGGELATGLEELTHMLTMLEDDECARFAVESRTA